MAKLPDLVNVTRLDALKGQYLTEYANLELELVFLFTYLLGVDPQKSLSIFSRMTNTRSRYALVDDLIRQSQQSEFRPFWLGLEQLLQPIDQFRNNLIHWVKIPDLKTMKFEIRPMRNFAESNNQTPPITEERIEDEWETLVLRKFLVHLFCNFLATAEHQKRGALREIYLQRATDQTLEALTKLQATS